MLQAACRPPAAVSNDRGWGGRNRPGLGWPEPTGVGVVGRNRPRLRPQATGVGPEPTGVGPEPTGVGVAGRNRPRLRPQATGVGLAGTDRG
ncbi:DUF1720 domain-containing protein [Sorangium sp. So ce367]|uniref:DUF1720 domain-containing protein n=1 Tax=Sorangium sp. So ce367 TaxID=3133305 RepID=UPI003F64782F